MHTNIISIISSVNRYFRFANFAKLKPFFFYFCNYWPTIARSIKWLTNLIWAQCKYPSKKQSLECVQIYLQYSLELILHTIERVGKKRADIINSLAAAAWFKYYVCDHIESIYSFVMLENKKSDLNEWDYNLEIYVYVYL